MSVSIIDMMKLPSFKEAKVVAGHSGMQRTVTSISVLEIDDPEILGFDAYGHTKYYGNEIIITAFISCRDNVEQQCETVRRLKEEGEIGIILFYVGCVLPKVDDQLVAVANELEMPLIIMPEGRIELRYSDVICDVMEAVIKDREENVYFAAELIEHISHIEVSRRSITGVLSLIRDRTHCSVFILDEADGILNFAEWPNKRDLPIEKVIKGIYNNKIEPTASKKLKIDEQVFYVHWRLIECGNSSLNLLMVKEKDNMTMDSCNQIYYVVKTYVNLWTDNYGQLNTKQLISAVINDEPEKMRLIADKLNIDIGKFSYTYFFFSKKANHHDYNQLKKVRDEIKDYVQMYNCSYLVDIFDETVIVTAEYKKKELDNDLDKLLKELEQQGFYYNVAVIDTICTTKEVKATYWLLQRYKEYIPVVFRQKYIITDGELEFLERCKKHFNLGIQNAEIKSRIEKQILPEKNKEILIETLETFLLDAEQSVHKTAELMYIHDNTAKYRMKNLELIFGHKLGRMPEVYELYFDAALNRLNRYFGQE